MRSLTTTNRWTNRCCTRPLSAGLPSSRRPPRCRVVPDFAAGSSSGLLLRVPGRGPWPVISQLPDFSFANSLAHLGMNAIPCGLPIPTRNGVIWPDERLRVPTKLITPASLGESVTGTPGTQMVEQTEYTPEALSATSRHPLAEVGQIVSSTWVPTERTLTVWDAVPGLWMNRSSPSPCDISTRSPCGSVLWESGSVRFSLTVETGGLRVVAVALAMSAGVSFAVVPDSVTLTRAGAVFFPALFSVGFDAETNADPLTNSTSSKPPPQDVFGTLYCVGVLLDGLMV